MVREKMPYTKKALTYTEQILRLRRKNVLIDDEAKAKEYLADIGYYRMGFYVHPFELTYPELGDSRRHEVRKGTKIEDIVALYYFDMDLRNILNKYLSRIEVSIRTAFVYELSHKYLSNPTWFVDPAIVSRRFVGKFDKTAYDSIKKKEPIRRHHLKYDGSYAPAWKTFEYMTLGNLEILYDSLVLDIDKKLISNHFGEPATATFKSYLSAIREVRNACAHGNILWCMTLTDGIRTGVACPSFVSGTHQTFCGALRVVDYLLGRISVNRVRDMRNELGLAVEALYSKSPTLQEIIEKQTGIKRPIKTKNIKIWANFINCMKKFREKFVR